MEKLSGKILPAVDHSHLGGFDCTSAGIYQTSFSLSVSPNEEWKGDPARQAITGRKKLHPTNRQAISHFFLLLPLLSISPRLMVFLLLLWWIRILGLSIYVRAYLLRISGRCGKTH